MLTRKSHRSQPSSPEGVSCINFIVQRRHCKACLVDVGSWALDAGKPWVLKAVHLALRREGLQNE